MSRFRLGDRTAVDGLVQHFYPELRRLAAARMQSERQEHTWTPTVLVNELYLELLKIKALRSSQEDSNERDNFLRLAGFIMRRLLIHHARPLYRKAEKTNIEDFDIATGDGPGFGAAMLAEVEDLLHRLHNLDPKLRTVVELRAFEGMTVAETAGRMGCSPRTVHKYWSFAKHWLAVELGPPTQGAESGT